MTGIIVVNKPSGITSFGVVAKVRRISGEKKTGHSGTLDPMATGVMTVLLGGATRFCEVLPSHDKAYEATLKLGTVTDTLDITGKILETREVSVTEKEFAKSLENFRGKITQVPPMYSAVSVGGRRLYDLARAGEEVERPEREVTVYKLELTGADEKAGEYKIYAECSSGTYIRTLIADIGEELGCGAVMTALRRVKANGFTIDKAYTIEELSEMAEKGTLQDALIPVDKAMDAYPAVTVTQAQAKRFSNGGELLLQRVQNCTEQGMYRVYGPEGDFLGIGENNGGESLEVKKVYVR